MKTFPRRLLTALLILVAVGWVFVVLRYAATQYPRQRTVSTPIDFISYVIGLVATPFVRRCCSIGDAYWNAPLELDGLRDDVEILRDGDGVPYVYARNEFDVFFAQGFIHATERPFQLELLRLLSQGQMAEVLGEDLLDTDFISRLCITPDVVLGKVDALNDERLESFSTYVKGVNAGYASLPSQPIEFLLLGHKPKTDWTVMDVMGVTTVLSTLLNRGLTGDIVRSVLKNELGDYWRDFDFGYPSEVAPVNAEGPYARLYDIDGSPLRLPIVTGLDTFWAAERPKDKPSATSVPSRLEKLIPLNQAPRSPGVYTDKRLKEHQEWLDEQLKDLDEKEKKHRNINFAVRWDGSNAWAVAGRLTRTGKPLLAGDPHLETQAPGFWVPMFLSSDGSTPREDDKEYQKCRAIGASTAGITGLFIGHNEYAGWSQTVAHSDIEDLYVVTLDDDGRHYYYDGKKYPLVLIEHEIKVKGRSKPFRYLVRSTHHGPLFSDAVPKLRQHLKKNQALAFASVALRSKLSSEWAAAMLFGKSWQDLINMSQYGQQNEFVTVWATRDGHIGASVSGSIPVRPHAGADRPYRDGSSSKEDWQGVLGPERVPSIMNPKSGIIVAGNCLLSDDKERLYGEVYVPGTRVRRAHQMLDATLERKKMDFDDLAEMQVDLYSIGGCRFKNIALETLRTYQFPNLPEDENHICRKEGLTYADAHLLYNLMSAWDCRMDSSSVGASIYEVWIQYALQDLFEARKFSAHTFHVLIGGGIHPTWLPRTEAMNHWRRNLVNAIENDAPVMSGVMSRNTLMCRSASHALAYLRMRHGNQHHQWAWGMLRYRFFDHIIGKAVPVLRHLLGVGPLTWGGNYGTLKAHHFEPHMLKLDEPHGGGYSEGLDTSSFRVVLDTSDWSKSKWDFYPGVSGWVGNEHYADRATHLVDGKERLTPMLWKEEDIRKAARTRKVLLSMKKRQRERIQREALSHQRRNKSGKDGKTEIGDEL